MTDQSAEQEAEAQQSRTSSPATPAADGSGLEKPEATEAVSEPTAEPTTSAQTSNGAGDGNPNAQDAGDDAADAKKASAEEKKATAEEFAREHDPAEHDIAAGEESRQRGDWTADEADGRVWDAEGNLVEVTSQTEAADGQGESDDTVAESDPGADGRRTSSLDEIRDGGYSVGSAALIDDGAMPLGHPVKAWEDTKTYVTPDDPGYDDGEPGLWFTDPGAARRAGFTPAD